MSFRTLKSMWIVAGVILGALAASQGQQPPARQGQPIIFSEPRRDTATSNLNEIVTQKKGPRDLEPVPQKTLDIFSVGDSGANFINPPLRQLPAPNVPSKRLKELLDKRRDRGFESPDDLVKGLTAEEVFKIPEFDRDGREKKNRNKMERYYEQSEREHLGNTNQMKGDDLFGRKKEHDGRDEPAFFGTQKAPDAAGNVAAPILKPMFSDDLLKAFSPDMNQSWNSDAFGSANTESIAATRARATRLQDYRDLFSPHSPAASSVPPLATRTVIPSFGGDLQSVPTGLGRLPTTTVGAPVAFPSASDNRQNLAPAPPLRRPLPPPAFELPKRKF